MEKKIVTMENCKHLPLGIIHYIQCILFIHRGQLNIQILIHTVLTRDFHVRAHEINNHINKSICVQFSPNKIQIHESREKCLTKIACVCQVRSIDVHLRADQLARSKFPYIRIVNVLRRRANKLNYWCLSIGIAIQSVYGVLHTHTHLYG